MSIELGGLRFSTPHLKLEESVRVWRTLGTSVMDLGNGVLVAKRPGLTQRAAGVRVAYWLGKDATET